MGTYETLMKGGKRGSPIVPGKSAESLLIKLVRHDREAVHAAQERGAADARGTGPDQAVDRPGRQGRRPGARDGRRSSSSAPPAAVQPVRGVAVSPDKSTVAAWRGNQIHIYDASSGTYIRSLIDPRPQGAGQEAGQGRPPVAGRVAGLQPRRQVHRQRHLSGSDPLGRPDRQLRKRLTGFADRVGGPGLLAPTASCWPPAAAPRPRTARSRSSMSTTGKIVIDIKNGHSDTVFGVCFSPDGKMLATCGADKFVKTFEVPSGKFIKVVRGPHAPRPRRRLEGRRQAAGQLRGRQRASRCGTTRRASRSAPSDADGQQAGDAAAVHRQDAGVRHRAAATDRCGCGTWTTAATRATSSGGTDFLYALGVSPDGAVVAAGGEEGVVRLYNGDNGQLIKDLLPPGVAPPAPPLVPKK